MQEPGRNQPPHPNQPPMQTSGNDPFANRSPIPSPTDFTPSTMTSSAMGTGTNDSGTGATAVLPEELKGFNWGAFLLTLFWGISHSTWIAIAAVVVGFIPFIGWILGLGFQIFLGIKGNEYAWQNREWDNIEHFRTVQRIWTRWGVGLIVGVFLLAILAAIMFPSFAKARQDAVMQNSPSSSIVVPR